MHSRRPGLLSGLIGLTFTLMVSAQWLLTRGYEGFAGDAQIYAFQALARIHPALSADLYLQYASQDRYTVFSSFYAWFIGWVGLETAARLLTLIFTLWFVTAAWNLAAAVCTRATAWLAVALLIATAGDYGAAGVFHVSEQFLTARLPGEALVITAFVFYARGKRLLGITTAFAALFVHPLMALPGLLSLVYMWLPARMRFAAALGGLSTILVIALAAATTPSVASAITVMDSDWVNVVRERSQFLFLQLWSVRDWDINLRPLVYLIFIARVFRGEPIRNFCSAGLVIGAGGLAVALVACLIGPVALLLQGQAWRWVWIACLLSTLLLPATLLRVWRDEKCGPLCAVLLTGGLLVPNPIGTASVLLALMCWLLRDHIAGRATVYSRWMAVAAGIALFAWIGNASVGHLSAEFDKIRTDIGVRVSVVLLFGFLWWRLRFVRSMWAPLLVSGLVSTSLVGLLPASFKQARILEADSSRTEFSGWFAAIPPTSTVFVAPSRDVGSFVWFTLQRPNYLALDQSAGVVFSRMTAMEIRRRSDVLLPVADPAWKILSRIRHGTPGHMEQSAVRPLTTQALIQVCDDPQLGFVISPENVGFDPIRHSHAGPWKDWNLYDCRRVRSNPTG